MKWFKKRKERDHLFIELGMELEMLRSEQKLHLFQMDDIVRLAYDSCNGNPDAIYNSVKNSNVIKNGSISHELKAQCEMISKLNKRIESLEKQAANDSLQKIVDKKDSFVIHGDLHSSKPFATELIEPVRSSMIDVIDVRPQFEILEELAIKTQKTIDEINAKREPSK